jgi:hypothetical protein
LNSYVPGILVVNVTVYLAPKLVADPLSQLF